MRVLIRSGWVAGFSAVVCAGPAAAQTWTSLNGPPSGSVADLLTSGGTTLAAGVDPARSDDAGLTWSVVNDHAPRERTRLVAVGDDVLAFPPFAAESPVMRTSDQGRTWTAVAPVPGALFAPILGVAAMGDSIFAVVTSDFVTSSLVVSHDHGVSWQPVAGAPSLGAVHAADGVLMGPSINAFEFARSEDGGQTWRVSLLTDIGLPGFFFGPFSFASAGGAVAMGGQSLGGQAGVFRSEDAGATWSAGLASAQAGLPVELFGDGGTIWAVTQQPTFFTIDLWRGDQAGTAWTRVETDLPINFGGSVQAAMTRHGDRLLIGSRFFGVIGSDDGGVTWSPSSSGLALSSVSAVAAADGRVLAGADERLWRFEGGAWSPSGLPAEGRIPLSLRVLDSGAVLAGTPTAGIYRTTDFGLTFQPVNAGVPQYNGTAGLQFREISAFAEHGGVIFAATGAGIEFVGGNFVPSGGGMLRSTDGGATWAPASSGLPIINFNLFGEPIFDPILGVAASDTAVVAGLRSRGVFRSTNGGASWQAANTGLTGLFIPAVSELGGDFFAISGGTVFRSEDSGASWTFAGGGLPTPVTSVHGSGGRLFAGVDASAFPDTGVFVSDDLGATWSRFGEPFADAQVTSITSSGSAVYAGTIGRGVWLAPAVCYADCDGSTGAGVLDFFDFICFQDRFALGDPYACDCDASTGAGVCDFFDFVCFQDAFTAGCP